MQEYKKMITETIYTMNRAWDAAYESGILKFRSSDYYIQLENIYLEDRERFTQALFELLSDNEPEFKVKDEWKNCSIFGDILNLMLYYDVDTERTISYIFDRLEEWGKIKSNFDVSFFAQA